MPDHRLSTPELARRLGLHPQIVRNWTAEHKLPHLRGPGNRLRFNWRDVKAVLSQKILGGGKR